MVVKGHKFKVYVSEVCGEYQADITYRSRPVSTNYYDTLEAVYPGSLRRLQAFTSNIKD